MPQMTSKELTAIEDQLNVEQTLIKKFQMYASECQDPELKKTCEQVAQKHQCHYDTLFQSLS